MQRIVDGILFEGVPVDDAWDLTLWESNGITEAAVRQVMEWREIGPCAVPQMTPDEYVAYLEAEFSGKELARRLKEFADLQEEKRLKALRKSAQRAKQMCRRIIIAENFTELLTLTYRDNQEDRELCKRHFKMWVQRMKRALGGEFRYCASFEKQDRGAMHVHIACQKLPKHVKYHGVKIQAWRLGTECWRGIVGKDNGLCFVGGKNKRGNRRSKVMSLGKLAQYVSKYIMKAFMEAPEESNRYSRSNGSPVPPKQSHRFSDSTLRQVIERVWEFVGSTDVVVSSRVGTFKDSFWLVVEKGRGSTVDPALSIPANV